MKLHPLVSIVCTSIFLALGCQNRAYMVKPEASYTDLAIRKSHTDADGVIHFIVFGKGANKEECRINAGYLLLKQLIYEGIDRGTEMKPLIGAGDFANRFRENEARYIGQLLRTESILQISEQKFDKIATAVKKKESFYQMAFEIALSPSSLRSEFKRITNQK